MPSPTHTTTRERRFTLAICLSSALLLASGSVAHGASEVSASGFGTLDLATDGTIYFDFGAATLDLTDITLVATTNVTMQDTLPPAPLFDASANITGTGTAPHYDFIGDLWLTSVDWTGNLILEADTLVLAGSIDTLLGTVRINAGPGSDLCASHIAGGIVLASATTPTCTAIPPERLIPGGGIIIVDPPQITAGVPEPGAALLFAVGFLALGAASRRR